MFLLSYSLLLDKTFKNQNQDGINIIYINRKLWNWRNKSRSLFSN